MEKNEFKLEDAAYILSLIHVFILYKKIFNKVMIILKLLKSYKVNLHKGIIYVTFGWQMISV